MWLACSRSRPLSFHLPPPPNSSFPTHHAPHTHLSHALPHHQIPSPKPSLPLFFRPPRRSCFPGVLGLPKVTPSSLFLLLFPRKRGKGQGIFSVWKPPIHAPAHPNLLTSLTAPSFLGFGKKSMVEAHKAPQKKKKTREGWGGEALPFHPKRPHFPPQTRPTHPTLGVLGAYGHTLAGATHT